MSEESVDLAVSAAIKRRRWFRRRDIRFIFVVVAIIVVFTGHGFFTGSSRMSAELRAELDKNPERVNVLVLAKFPAEAFHMGVYQDLGSMQGKVGDAVKLFRMTPGDVRTLARNYWIEEISLAPTGLK